MFEHALSRLAAAILPTEPTKPWAADDRVIVDGRPFLYTGRDADGHTLPGRDWLVHFPGGAQYRIAYLRVVGHTVELPVNPQH